MKILLAIDGSPCSEAAVAEVCRRPWPPQSEVRLLTVEPPIDESLVALDSATVFDAVVAQQRVETVKRLKHATDLFRSSAPGLLVTPVVREGWPKEVILDEAEHWGADLVVVGSHGYGAIQRFLLGSVSLAVATNAPCSVEIVRPPLEKANS